MNSNGQELTAEDIMRAALTPDNFEQWKTWNERQKTMSENLNGKDMGKETI